MFPQRLLPRSKGSIALQIVVVINRDWMRLGSSGCLLAVSLIALGGHAAAQRHVPESAGNDKVVTSDIQIIDDPELARRSNGPVYNEAANDSSVHPLNSTMPAFVSDARLRLRSRIGVDILHGDAREETWESTSIAIFEATVRRSEHVRFAVGMRARLQAASLSAAVPDAAAPRLQLDVAPTAGYVDIKLGGSSLQLGYQTVHLGSFDLISAVDVLSVMDVRAGPATLPEASDVAQLALRFDYDPTPSLSLRALYVPFFTPHILSVAEGDYAMARLTQAQVTSGIANLGLDNAVLAANLSRADRERLAETGMSVFTPEVSLAAQQAALRATLHGTAGELSFTAATALEHLPAFYFTQEAIDYLRDPRTVEVVERFQKTIRPIRVEYGRFALLALDSTIDVAPFSVGFEAAYSFHRTLYTLGSGPYPGTLPLPDTTDLIQAGARIEYLRGTEFASTIQAFGVYTMRTPRDPSRGWISLERDRYLLGVAAAAIWAPEGGPHIELGVVATTGFTWIVMPRIEFALFNGLAFELGAIIIEGPPPPMNVTPHIALGTIYSTTDQVFAGFSYSY
jgi:hypothetical protein